MKPGAFGGREAKARKALSAARKRLLPHTGGTDTLPGPTEPSLPDHSRRQPQHPFPPSCFSLRCPPPLRPRPRKPPWPSSPAPRSSPRLGRADLRPGRGRHAPRKQPRAPVSAVGQGWPRPRPGPAVTARQRLCARPGPERRSDRGERERGSLEETRRSLPAQLGSVLPFPRSSPVPMSALCLCPLLS